MKYLDKYPNCIGCPVKKWCGTMISCIRLCKSYQENKTEMNYEERYKQAIEAAKRELNCCGTLNCDAARQIFRLFPELRESEDERIRKALIKYLDALDDDEIRYGVSFKDMRTWLEKQGTPQVRTDIEWVNAIDDACNKRYSEEYSKGEYCHEQSFKWGFQEGVDWLEKQGEQKPKVDLGNKFEWHNIPEETPKFGDTVIVACKNKNKEDGIWLYDLIQCWEGKWEPRENWETPLKWISVDELGLNARKEK